MHHTRGQFALIDVDDGVAVPRQRAEVGHAHAFYARVRKLPAMCTLVIARRVFPGIDLAVAANRDERYDRPARGPVVLDARGPLVGGVDLTAGGTWFAAGARLMGGITNRTDAPHDHARPSRGRLLLETLQRPSLEEALTFARAAAVRVNPHVLWLDDGVRSVALTFDGRSLHERELGEGIHVVASRDVDDDGDARAREARTALEALAARPPDGAKQLALALEELLRSHAEPGALCRHFDGRGTRSASVIVQPERGTPLWHWAEGAPCSSPFVPVNSFVLPR
ncbi:hypothetical protein EPN52_05175 [bacterium]|nr:MAG: hypothetical protein EPN52_05175 [bacterium]